MKVCIREHVVPSFGTIPVGSLWDDDSPYVVEADCFAEDDDRPKYATGGVVDNSKLYLIGTGDPEIVVPLKTKGDD